MLKIAISTHKGGAGKTVTAINLAAAIARTKKTLLIDMDPQAHSTLGLGLNIGLDEPTIADVLQDPRGDLHKVIRPVGENLSLIPSTIHLARTAELLYAGVRREERLGQALASINGFEIAVIDCKPDLGTLTTNAIACADWILVPCEMGARAADGLVDLLELVSLLKGSDFNQWRIVLTKFDARKSLTNEAVLKSLAPYSDHILPVRVGVCEALNQAQFKGKDIFQFEPSGRGAEDYRELGQEILSLVQGRPALTTI